MVSSTVKFVLLCLPGKHTSAKVLEKQLEISGLRRLLNEYADPRLPALGDPDPSLLKLDVPREFFEWLRIKGETVEQQYVEGLPETLEYIQKKVQDVFLEYGRFDGFLGYSQGASCALIMSLSYASGTFKLPSPPKFLLLFAGFIPGHFISKLFDGKNLLTIEALHIVGQQDENYETCRETARRLFVCPKILTHLGGHVMPRIDRQSPTFISTVVNFLDNMRRTFLDSEEFNAKIQD